MEDVNTVLDGVCGSAIRLMRSAPGTVTRLRLQAGDSSLELEWIADDGRTRPVPAPSGTAAAVKADEADEDGRTDLTYIRAPMIGTFYRSPAPGEPPFVREGDVVAAGTQVGILEAMKLMNPIEADWPGRVVEILVADGTPVEYDQRLIATAPVEDE
jgi:acetyl-CoA carboxylase biotin carboxyl carrier protein